MGGGGICGFAFTKWGRRGMEGMGSGERETELGGERGGGVCSQLIKRSKGFG